MALDEATSTFLARMAESGLPPLHEMDPVQARGMTGTLKQMYGKGPDVARNDAWDVPAGDHTVRVQALVPTGLPRAVIVYYHGGGWVTGALDEFETLGRELAVRTGCAVALVDYRLAPEHPYPAAVDDAWDALVWIEENTERIAGASIPVIAAGDSAGGNLAAVVSRRARDRGVPVTLQVLVYPVTDSGLDTPSYLAPENQLMLSRDSMIWFWDHYVADELRRDPDVSPARVDDLSGLPPAVVVTGEHDVLRDEGEAYADALERAGVRVRRRCVPGQMHGFFTMVNVLPGSEQGIDFVAAQIEQRLSRTGGDPDNDEKD